MAENSSLRLSPEDFEKSFENVPRFAISLLVKNSAGQFLLTKRSIPPEKGSWHLPGSFLLKNETLSECILRIQQKELGTQTDEESTLVGLFEDVDQDPRGHVVDAIYEVKIDDLTTGQTDESEEIRFFDSAPEGVGFNHAEYLKRLGLG